MHIMLYILGGRTSEMANFLVMLHRQYISSYSFDTDLTVMGEPRQLRVFGQVPDLLEWARLARSGENNFQFTFGRI